MVVRLAWMEASREKAVRGMPTMAVVFDGEISFKPYWVGVFWISTVTRPLMDGTSTLSEVKKASWGRT